MSSTPNYGWDTPDNTGLVKNGALDMRTLGNAIDTTMATKAVASNPVINSAFQVWQRGTSPTFVANNSQNYQSDRWNCYSLVGGRTITRQITGDTTNLPFIQYCARVQRTAGDTATNEIQFIQNVESADSIPFAGKTVTLSFYARKGANYSAASSALTAILTTGTGTDQNVIFPGFTGGANPIIGTATLTTTWQRFSYSATLGNNITQIAPRFAFNPVGTAGAADFYEITGVQVDIGGVALPFQTASGGSIQGELAMCQRYYQKYSGDGSAFCSGTYFSTTNFYGVFAYPTMRVAPTGVIGAAAVTIFTSGGGRTSTACGIAQQTTNNLEIIVTTGIAIQGDGAFARFLSTGSLELSAEL
jgi:hypothetical protein